MEPHYGIVVDFYFFGGGVLYVYASLYKLFSKFVHTVLDFYRLQFFFFLVLISILMKLGGR